jgi:hypothetical protein
MFDLTNTELWGLAIAALLACILSGWIAKKDMKIRSSWKDTDPFSHEPILWAEPGSWWKVPIYRMEKMLFVDVVSPSGAFACVMTWIFKIQYLDLAKSSVWGTICVTALFLLAWTNFALPKYRPQFVGALIALIRAFATFVAGRWGGGSNQPVIPEVPTVRKPTGMEPNPEETLPTPPRR